MSSPVSGGTLMTGGRMTWEGIKWIARSRQAPWSIINMSATVGPHIVPWYSIRFFGQSEKPFAIELVSVRTIRPKGLLFSFASKASARLRIGRYQVKSGRSAGISKL